MSVALCPGLVPVRHEEHNQPRTARLHQRLWQCQLKDLKAQFQQWRQDLYNLASLAPRCSNGPRAIAKQAMPFSALSSIQRDLVRALYKAVEHIFLTQQHYLANSSEQLRLEKHFSLSD